MKNRKCVSLFRICLSLICQTMMWCWSYSKRKCCSTQGIMLKGHHRRIWPLVALKLYVRHTVSEMTNTRVCAAAAVEEFRRTKLSSGLVRLEVNVLKPTLGPVTSFLIHLWISDALESISGSSEQSQYSTQNGNASLNPHRMLIALQRSSRGILWKCALASMISLCSAEKCRKY